MKQVQDNYFLQGEGDAWFKRNETYLKESTDTDWPLFLLEKYNLRPQTVLEIGCSNGWRLAKILANNPGIRCVGVEPSEQAIADGRVEYPGIEFHHSIASEISLDEQFDVVIVNFVLHWISREKILQSIAQIDRLVKDGGYLIIGDFSPDQTCRSAYHHLPEAGIFTYKTDYAKIFSSTNLYKAVSELSFDHGSKELKAMVSSNNRGSCVLLRKSLTEFYPEVKLSA